MGCVIILTKILSQFEPIGNAYVSVEMREALGEEVRVHAY